MPKRNTVSRKALFRAALALNEMTAGRWAREEGISESLLSLLLDGYRPTSPVHAKIDAYIQKHMAGHSALAS
jgi:hypothetical protein